MAAAVTTLLALTAAGCGEDDLAGAAADDTSEAASSGHGDWLLRFTTAEGADGEKERAVYVLFDPLTGAASAQALPGVTAGDATAEQQALLVSADHARAIPDTAVPKAEAKTGKLVVYSTTSDAAETLDIRGLTGDPAFRAVAWAFDPADSAVLRVVGADRSVWRIDLDAGSAAQEGRLPTRDGWIFGNGFDKNTGEPYIESIDSDLTEPAGNGGDDTRPVERQGGQIVPYDGAELADLPTPPCGFASAFRFDEDDAWLFCADTPSISAYRLAEDGKRWEVYGVPSKDIVPGAAADMAFALPPVV